MTLEELIPLIQKAGDPVAYVKERPGGKGRMDAYDLDAEGVRPESSSNSRYGAVGSVEFSSKKVALETREALGISPRHRKARREAPPVALPDGPPAQNRMSGGYEDDLNAPGGRGHTPSKKERKKRREDHANGQVALKAAGYLRVGDDVKPWYEKERNVLGTAEFMDMKRNGGRIFYQQGGFQDIADRIEHKTPSVAVIWWSLIDGELLVWNNKEQA